MCAVRPAAWCASSMWISSSTFSFSLRMFFNYFFGHGLQDLHIFLPAVSECAGCGQALWSNTSQSSFSAILCSASSILIFSSPILSLNLLISPFSIPKFAAVFKRNFLISLRISVSSTMHSGFFSGALFAPGSDCFCSFFSSRVATADVTTAPPLTKDDYMSSVFETLATSMSLTTHARCDFFKEDLPWQWNE